MQSLQEGLEGAETADDCWTLVQGGCQAFKLRALRMQFAGQIFHCPSENGSRQSWAMRIPISESDWIELSHDSTPEEYSAALVPFANTLRRVLASKRIQEAKPVEKPQVFSPVMYKTQQSPAA